MSYSQGDNPDLRTYAAAMERGLPIIHLRLGVSEPVGLSEFVGAFLSLSSEYDRYIRREHPEMDPEATLYVKEVRSGSIEADIVPWLFVGQAVMATSDVMNAALTVEDFVRRYAERLGAYFRPGGRTADLTRSELRDFLAQVAVIANHPGATAEIAALEIEDGQRKVRSFFKFDNSQAREAQQQIELHRREIEHAAGADHRRVLMVFTQTNVNAPKLGKRSGDRVRIEAIGPQSRALIYASEMAEERIKHEITEAEDNVYKKGFVVDVNVQLEGGRPVAYRVTHVHQVIDLPDEGEDE